MYVRLQDPMELEVQAVGNIMGANLGASGEAASTLELHHVSSYSLRAVVWGDFFFSIISSI